MSGLFYLPPMLSRSSSNREGHTRSLGDVLGREEERQNLISGGIVISILCAMIIAVFLVVNLNIGIEPRATTVNESSQTAARD